MADSTCTPAAPPVPLPKPRPAPPAQSRDEAACNEATRADLARLVDRQLPEITTGLLHGDPFGGSIPQMVEPPIAQLVHQAMPTVSRLCHGMSFARREEVVPFRFLGALCAHQCVEPEKAAHAVNGAAEAVADLLLARGRELDDLYGAANVDQAVAVMCGQLENFASRAVREVETGYARMEACPDAPSVEAGGLIDLLDERDDVGDETPDHQLLEPDTPRAVAVLVATGHRDDTPALLRAAQEMEVHVPGAIDCGLGQDPPTHARVVIPRPFGHDARDLHGVLQHIAVSNGVVIVVQYPGAGLNVLQRIYRDTLALLPEVIALDGRRSSVITAHHPTAPRTPLTVAA